MSEGFGTIGAMNEMPSTLSGRRLGYLRVSTDAQDELLQRQALDKAGVDVLYMDHAVSGTATSRPKLDKMLADMHSGDTVVFYSLSRLSRGTKHLLELSERFEQAGVGMVSCTEPIDTTSPAGRFAYTLLAAVATMEREVLAERTKAGLAAARSRGAKIGRPPSLSTADRRHAKMLFDGGSSAEEIAASLRCSKRTVYRALAV
ncbi:site-specific recombinase PinR [Mycobacteroides abscessus subsp. abscessus]|nr:site-specific recombinase PinR [Mycobacteroides abscessus subsp. abscessus]SHQ55496.1 site-specific recombinase PinR [Mycobacteroides abscessus subsp. abscessus]SHQ95984.1 site-specific recombinase PinR [Mycobacteroides abscessus subsp. abscessus]SHR09068.1 site-specific recombinase PinR [Mycobacteroides abscessus subsp. abscessus]SHR11252.1 site-specific recombinase PinR [Mycobacteroides abscessus subsp. abscessus]